MSLMAGFDFIAEISNEVLLKLIKTQFTILGTPANPPFELNVPINAINGNAHFIVEDLLLDLTDDDRMTLTLKFTNTSFIGQSPVVTVAALNGQIVLNAKIMLATPASPPGAKVLAFDLSSYLFSPDESAVIDIDFVTPDDEIAAALAGTGITLQAFKSQAQQTIASFFNSMGVVTFDGVAFRVVPGVNGSLSPLLIFERLEAHCIGNSDPKKQALGLFGILLLANDSNGDHTQKTAPAITPGLSSIGPHEVAVSLSPGAFHSLQFCPGISTQVGKAIGDLPTTCGSASGFDQDGVTITSIVDSFGSGHISIDGLYEKSGFCYEATGSFHGTITFDLSNNILTPVVQMDEPDTEVELDWYCEVGGVVAGGWLAGFVGGIVAAIILAIVNGIAESIADDLGQSAIKNALGKSLPGTGLPAFAGAIFDERSVTPEGLTVNGFVPMFVPFSSGTPGLDLSGSVTTSSTQDLSSGTYHYPGILLFCDAKDFPYIEKAQKQTATYQAIVSFLGLPLNIEWWLHSYTTPTGAVKIPLTGNSGIVSLPDHTHFPFPLDSGGTALDQLVHVEYLISNDVVQLKNKPSEGNYALSLHCKATDPVGNVAEESTYVVFEGNVVEIGGGYDDYVAECNAKARGYFQRLSAKYAKDARLIPKWVPINYPPSEKLLELLYSLAASPAPEAEAVLAQTITSHGSSFLRALFDLQAGKIGFAKGKVVVK